MIRCMTAWMGALVLAGCAGQPSNYYARPGVERARFEADVGGCKAEMDAALAAPTPSAGGTLIGVALGSTIAFEQGRSAGRGFDGCMASRGYRLTPMTEEQHAAVAAMSPEEVKVAAAKLSADGKL